MGRKGVSVCMVMVLLLGSMVVLDVTMDITPRVEAIVIYVDDDYGSEDATHKMTIQTAVDAANPGDTVFVYAGIYHENVEISKTITLIGEDKNTTIINGSNDWVGIRIELTNFVNITGFTLESAVTSGIHISFANYCYINNNIMTQNKYGISIDGSFNTIANNTLDNNWGYGYRVDDYYNYIEQSNTVNGEIVYYYYDIHGTESSPIIITGLDLITSNVSTVGKINLINCSNISVSNSNVSNNLGPNFNMGLGLLIRNSENITVNNLTASNNRIGIYMSYTTNISIDLCNLYSNTMSGVWVIGSNNETIINNTFNNNAAGLKFTGVQNSLIKNNTFISGGYAISFSLYSDNNLIISNKILSSSGLYFRGTINNTILDNNINVTSGYGFEVHNSELLSIINSTIQSNSYNFVFQYMSGSVWEEGTVYVINSSYNESKVYYYDDTIDLHRQWYLHINVTDSLGQPMPNVDVCIEDNQNSLPAQKYTTDSEGYVRWLTQTEYIEWDTNGDHVGEKTYYTPHRITAWNETLMGYAEVNINESKEVNIVLDTPYYEIPLSAGWNLISLPLVQSDTSISTVLSSIAGNYDIVQWYNASDGKWHSTNDDLTDINHTMGFWIHMKTADTLIVNGTIPNTTSIHLYQGWNLVGNPSFCIHGIDDILSPIATKYTAVQQYDSWDSGDPWKHYHINKSPGFNDLAYMTSGRGYWLYVKEDCVWEVSNF